MRARGSLLAALALAAVAARAQEPAPPSPPRPASDVAPPDSRAPAQGQDMSDSPLGLGGTDYWDNPWKNNTRLIDEHVYGEKYGVFIDAPPEVDLNKRTTIPMPLFWAASPDDAVSVDLQDTAKLVVCDVGRRTVAVVGAVTPTDEVRDSPPRGKRSVGSSQNHVTDLATRGGVRDVGTYVVTVLLRDKAANRRMIKVTRPPTGYQDPEVARFLEEQRAKAVPPPPAAATPAGRPFPAFAAAEGSPSVPASPGLAVTAPRVFVLGQGKPCAIRVAFRLIARPEDVVPPPPPLEDKEARLRDRYGEPRPTAIIPITVVITASKDVSEKVHHLRVPTWDPVPAAGGPVTGHLALDLFGDMRTSRSPQTHFVSVFAAEHMSGPHSIGVVSEDQLGR